MVKLLMYFSVLISFTKPELLLNHDDRETFHPEASTLGEDTKRYMVQEILNDADIEHHGEITFDQFIPW